MGAPWPASCSISVWANSSRKKGLPWALARSASASCQRDGLLLEHRLDDLHTVLGRERRHGKLGGVGFLQPRRPIPRAVGAQDQEGRAGEAIAKTSATNSSEEGSLQCKISHNENERVLLTALQPELPQRRKGVRLQRVRADTRHLHGGRLHSPADAADMGLRCPGSAPPPGADRAPSR